MRNYLYEINGYHSKRTLKGVGVLDGFLNPEEQEEKRLQEFLKEHYVHQD